MNWPEQKAVVRTTTQNATNIRKAFDASMDGDQITSEWFATHPAGGSVSPQMARDWALAHVQTNKKPIELALSRIYADGYVLGEKVAKTRLLGLLVKDAVSAGVVDWANWVPGSSSAAALVRPQGGLKELLRTRKINIADDVIRTKLDRIGTSLASSLEQGLGARETAKVINTIINDPQHALVIARTEMSRAISVATRDRYEEANVKQVEWLVAEGCDDCQENADASPIGIDETFPTGDAEPPAHPNCMCALAPVFDDEEPVAEEEQVEDFAIDDILAEPEFTSQDFLPLTNEKEYIAAMNQPVYSGTIEQRNAVAIYQTSAYQRINNILRDVKPKYAPQYDEIVKENTRKTALQIDAAIENSPALDKNLLAYRGVNSLDKEMTAALSYLKPGDVFVDNAFISTSLKEKTAIRFANAGYKLEIEMPKGTKGIYPETFVSRSKVNIVDFTDTAAEVEWLLPRGSKLKVLNIEGKTIRMRVIQ